MTRQRLQFCSSCGASTAPEARFCAQCGTAIVDAPPPPAAGERRQAVVVFADLCGFTELSRRLDAEEVHALLARFFAAVDGEIRRHGGTIDKHVGDAVMGVFGAPVSHGNDAERAVRAALAMHAAVAGLGQPEVGPLAIHVGVASGEVVAGRTGSALHSEYTVTGPAANLAARLVERAGRGETLVSEAVVAAARRIVGVTALGETMLKGVDVPVRLWRVAGPPLSAAPPPPPLIGRDGARAQLSALLAAAASGRGQLAVLRGDPGIGKTRLLEEAVAIADERGLRCVRAGVLDFGLGRGGDVGRVIARALAPAVPELPAAHAPALDDLLDRPRDAASAAIWGAMTPVVREAACRAALAALAVAAAATAPLLVAIEDLHWADADSLGRIAAIAAAAPARPIAIVLTTRRDGDPLDDAWRGSAGAVPVTTIDLAPLDAEAALRLAQAVLPAAGPAAHAWVARAEGNPLFLIELVRHAVEAPSALPDTIQSVVQARIDRLAPADKALIQCASVAGQRVDPALLAVLAGQNPVDDERLLAAGLLRRDGEALVFAHALVRDGVYATLLRAHRRELHRQAAAYHADRDRALEAQHLDRAEDARAPAAYAAAAIEAEARGQIAVALALAERGLALATAPGDRASLGLIQGEALLELGRTAEAEAAFRAILVHAQAPADRCRAWLGVADSLRVLSRVDDALAALVEADAARDGDGSLVVCAARTHHLRGNLFFARGDAAACEREHRRALDLARSAGSAEYEARALNGLGDAAYAAGRMTTALRSFERSSALCASHGFRRIDSSNRFMIGNCLLYQNRLADGVAVLRDAVATAERAGGRLMRMVSHESIGILLEESGADEAAVEELDRALALSRELGSRRYDAIILAVRSLALARLGRGEAARRDALEADRVSAETGRGFVGAMVLGVLAQVSGDAAIAQQTLAQGERLLAEGCVAHNHLWFHRSAMEVNREAGRFAEALRHAAALEAFTAAESLPWPSFHIRRTRTLVAAARGGRDAGLTDDLAALRREAVEAGLAPALSALDAALATATAPPGAPRA